jgi:EAL domain-containing protein (putative c-di-GMP-specific phosphodiesterase class I)/FixJ family two-component response regulator
MYDSLTVLVVDDEPIQRQIASRMLRTMTVGEVVETDDGARALEIIEARGSAVDLVICDLDMPKMDGMEFIRRLADIAPSPALIINSSHKAEILESVGRMGTAYGLRVLGSLEKPFTRSALAPLLAIIASSAEKLERPKIEHTEIDLEKCLAEGRFIPYFQPKLLFEDCQVTAAETLIRLDMGNGEIIAPGLFMNDVVKQGLITEVTLALFDATLSIVGDWNQGGHHPHISFNLSPESLDDFDFGSQLNQRVAAAGVSSRDITFEVVESEIAKDFRRSMENTTRLRMLGFGLAIDDFGTGFSSMEQLGMLPFTELKVDQSFVTGICDNPQKQAMVTSTVRMAKDLKLTVVAEGIETEDEAKFVAAAGCDFGQGYWLSRPIAAAAFKEFMVERASSTMVQ